MTTPGAGGDGPPEVTGLGSARSYATGMVQAFTRAAARTQTFAARLGGHGVDGPAVAALARAQELTSAAAAAWEQASGALDQQTVVQEAYAVTPDAGDKQFLTDGATPEAGVSTPAPPPDAGPVLASRATTDAGGTPPTEIAKAQRDALAPVLIALLPALNQARMMRQSMAEAGTDDILEIYEEIAESDGDTMFDLMGKDITALHEALHVAATAAGLHPEGEAGHTVAYDPELHHVSGREMGDATQVVVKRPGLTWHHGGDSKVVDKPYVVPYDDDRGAHVYESVNSLSDVEEREEPVEVWIDPAKYPVPGAEDVDPDPDYYTMTAATACTADDEYCDKFGTVPAGTNCGSYWVEIDRYGDQCLHLPGDHKFAVADDVEVVA